MKGDSRSLRVALILPSLTAGGAERVAVELANKWTARGRGVCLITVDGSEGDHFKLTPKVQRISLDSYRASKGIASTCANAVIRIRRLREGIRLCKADVLISFLVETNVVTLLASRGLEIPVLVSERNHIKLRPTGVPWRILRYLTYSWASAVVVATDRQRAAVNECVFGKLYTAVIPNPVSAEAATIGCKLHRPAAQRLVAVGRLTPQKGFDLLLRAFAIVAERFPSATLTIMGDGPLRQELEALTDTLGLWKRVSFAGVVMDSLNRLSEHDIFVLSSRYEGFPNVLLEAMACGLPVISFDCPTGPREIISHGQNGMLVENGDIKALAETTMQVLGDENLQRSLGKRARTIRELYSGDRILDLWDQLLGEVACQSGSVARASS